MTISLTIANSSESTVMDECCRIAHAKLISGKCPWCGRTVINGKVVDLAEKLRSVSCSGPFAGPSLKSVIDHTGPLDPVTAVRYASAVAAFLGAHFPKKPHKNVSPDNIFVVDPVTAKLGPAFTFDDDEIVTPDSQDNVLGMVDYLAPELALTSHMADYRADIYSLGCTLFFMLTGKPPIEGTSISEKLLKHQIEPPVSLQIFNPDVSSTLDNVYLKLVAKKPSDRYQTWQEVQLALAICLDG